MLDGFQRFLDDLSAAMMAGDYDRYRPLVARPLIIVKESATVIVEQEEQFRQGFDNLANMLKTLGATHLIRLAHAVTEYTPRLITGRYETHILNGGKRVFGPFMSSASLVCVDGRWMMNSVINPIQGEAWPDTRRGVVPNEQGKL